MLFGSTLFVYWGEKCKYPRDRYIFYFFSFIIIFIPTAIRYDVGTDFLAYINIYNHLDSYSTMEPAFFYINKALSILEAPAQYSIAIFAFIFLLVLFTSAPPKNKYVFLFIAISLLMFISFNGIRQAVSIAFSLLALKYFIGKDIIKSFLCIVIGALFHKSIIILLPFLFLSTIPIARQIKMGVIPVCMIALIFIANIAVDLMIFFLGNTALMLNIEYASYYGHSRHFVTTSIGSGLGILAKLLFSIYTISATPFLLKINPRYWVLIILTFCYSLATILAKEIEIFGRLEQIFIIAPIFCSYIFITEPPRKNLKRYIALIYILFITLSFYKTVIDGATNYTDPKLYPYQTIFSKEAL